MSKENKGNTGEENTGDNNSGNRNSGDNNSGYRNSGDNNSGYNNSGNNNSGNRNSGDNNSGYNNSGNNNSGNNNSGDNNSGNWNSGDRNSGYNNSGDNNSGNWNSGYGNSINRESGIFNSEEGKLRMFNKPIDKKWDDIDHPHFYEFYLTKWITKNEMTKEEKKNHPDFLVRQGYLKTFTWNEAWANFWKDTDEKNRQKFLNLPNFSWKVFTSITGLEPDKKEVVKDEITIDGVRYKKIKDDFLIHLSRSK